MNCLAKKVYFLKCLSHNCITVESTMTDTESAVVNETTSLETEHVDEVWTFGQYNNESLQ